MIKVLIYNSKPYNNNYHLIISLINAFNDFNECQLKVANYYSIGLFIKEFNPDIVIAFGGEELPIDLIPLLKKQHTTWILWTTEDPFEINRNLSTSQFFNIVFTSDKKSQSYYKHPHCYYLPLAADVQIFYRPVIENPNDLTYDISFVGTAWPNRTSFLIELLELIRKYNLSSRFIMPTNLSIPLETLQALEMHPFERNFRISPMELANLNNRSGFVISMFRDFSADGKVRPQTSPTNRFFETSLAGTGQVLVSDEINIKSFYPQITDSVFQCSKAKEIVDIIQDNKKNNYQLRNKSASKIQSFVLQNHLYKHRVKQMLDTYYTFIGSLS
jgi:spore maturation protein CgeB